MIMNKSFDDLFNQLTKFSIGFEPLFGKFDLHRDTATSYPPYNIEKISDNQVRLTLAVAGFSKDDIEVSLLDKVLTVVGDNRSKKEIENDEPTHALTISQDAKYLHRGIANRRFLRDFIIDDHTTITNCNLKDGLLTVDFLTSIPKTNPTILQITSD